MFDFPRQNQPEKEIPQVIGQDKHHGCRRGDADGGRDRLYSRLSHAHTGARERMKSLPLLFFLEVPGMTRHIKESEAWFEVQGATMCGTRTPSSKCAYWLLTGWQKAQISGSPRHAAGLRPQYPAITRAIRSCAHGNAEHRHHLRRARLLGRGGVLAPAEFRGGAERVHSTDGRGNRRPGGGLGGRFKEEGYGEEQDLLLRP